MKHLLTFMQFVNEADAPKAPVPPPPKEDEDENKPATPTATPPTTGASPDASATGGATATTPGVPNTTDANSTASPTDAGGTAATDIPAAPGSTPDASTGAASGTDATSGAATGGATGGTSSTPSSAGTPDAGGLGSAPTSGGSAGTSSGGSSLGEPLADEDTETPPKPEADQSKSEKPEDYVPPVSKFNMVLMDKNAKWEQEYPDGGGVKEMEGFEVSWKDLNKWIDQNKLGGKKKDIAEYLMGENDDLDQDVKAKLKNAFTSKTLGDDTGNTEVEFDNDLTPYVQDINTIIVDL